MIDIAGSKNHKKMVEKEEEMEGGKKDRLGAGGVHNPSNRLPAGERLQSVIPVAAFTICLFALEKTHDSTPTAF